MWGGDDNDTANAGTNAAILPGDTGDDILRGGDGDDVLVGGSEADFFYGEFDNDQMPRGAGDDYFAVGLDQDTIRNVAVRAASQQTPGIELQIQKSCGGVTSDHLGARRWLMVQERSRKTRAKVLEAARELIIERGYEQVSLKDICDRSGVSNGSVFHHFGSKEGIIRQLFKAERGAYLHAVQEAILAHDGDPCDAFAAGTRAAMHYQAVNPVRYERLIAEFADSEWLRQNVDIWLEVASEEEQPVIEWAAKHFASGELPVLPPAFYQAAALGPTELLSRSHRQGRLASELEAMGDDLAQFVSAGLKGLRERQRAAKR